jgi:hypothetical protein
VRPDWHHHFHPRTSPILKEFGGEALRNARLQLVDYDTHHFGYHNKYDGPPLAKTVEGRFAAVVMSVAGYIPKEAIDFEDRSPKLIRLSDDQRRQLQASGEIESRGDAVIRNFIRDYIMEQQITATNVNELTIEEFVSTRNVERRRLLGHTLLALITDLASEPIHETYSVARRNQLIKPGLPTSARRFTKGLLGPTRSRDKIVNRLHKNLAIA